MSAFVCVLLGVSGYLLVAMVVYRVAYSRELDHEGREELAKREDAAKSINDPVERERYITRAPLVSERRRGQVRSDAALASTVWPFTLLLIGWEALWGAVIRGVAPRSQVEFESRRSAFVTERLAAGLGLPTEVITCADWPGCRSGKHPASCSSAGWRHG